MSTATAETSKPRTGFVAVLLVDVLQPLVQLRDPAQNGRRLAAARHKAARHGDVLLLLLQDVSFARVDLILELLDLEV